MFDVSVDRRHVDVPDFASTTGGTCGSLRGDTTPGRARLDARQNKDNLYETYEPVVLSSYYRLS